MNSPTPKSKMNSTKLYYVIEPIVSWTQYGVDTIRRGLPDEAARAEEVDWCLRHIEHDYYISTKREPLGSEWRDLLTALISHAAIVLKEAKREAGNASATEELVSVATALGIPDVARRAEELHDAVRAVGTDDYDVTRRIRTLVMPFAKEARLEAKRKHHQKALALTEQAVATLRVITDEAEA